MKMLIHVGGLGLLLASVLMAADYEKIAEKKLFNGETVYEYRLSNGVRTLFVPRHQAKTLTYQTWFDVGSLNEKMDPKLQKTGLAHLFEHMMFRGTKKHPDGQFDSISSRIGSDKQNATTYYYRTNYFQSVPSNQLDKIMELESDRMANLNLIGELLEKEKGAVVGELRRALDNPNRLAWDELMRQVYEKSPFRYTVLGTEEEIKGFTLEEGQYFYRTFYAPNNCTLIVIGDTTEAELMKKVVKYYGAMKPQEVPKLTLPDEPEQKKERRWEGTHQQATSEILLIGYRLPSLSAREKAALGLLSGHLSDGMEARLRKILVDKGIAVGAGSELSNKPDVFEFSAFLADKRKAEEALAAIDKEIAQVKAAPISAPAFERAMNQSLLALYASIGDNSALGNMFGEYLMMSGNYLEGFEILEASKTLKPSDLQAAAKRFLDVRQRSVVIVRPVKKEKS